MRLTESQTIRPTVTCKAEELAIDSVIRNAIGERTITKFCEDSGLSIGYMSRLLNGKLKTTPSVKTLAKISCSGKEKERKSTFSTLLKICGHDLDKDEMQRELSIAEQASKILEKGREDDRLGKFNAMNLSASAVGSVFRHLLMMGVPLQPKGYFGPDDGIEFGVKGYPFERVVILSGFCEHDHQAVETERNILRQLLKYGTDQEDVPMYLLLTNNQDAYDYLSDVIVDSVKAYKYVLLTSDDGMQFTKQTFIAADDKMQKAPFIFTKNKL